MRLPACCIAGATLLLCLSVGRVPAQNPGAPESDDVDGFLDRISLPVLIMDPEYPETARNLRAAGVVGLSAVIEADGTASDFRVTKPLGYGLEDKAIEAVRRLRYNPGMKNGSPAPVRAAFGVRFPPIRNPIPDRWFSGPMEFSIGTGLTPPVVTGGTMPKPDGKLNYEHLVLGFTVDASGIVRNIHAVSGEPESAKFLARYLTTWKFLPAMSGQQPVEVMGTVRFWRGSEDPETSVASGLAEKIYVKGDGISAPRIRKKVDPVYPETARVNKIQGSVVLALVIDGAGNVVNAEVLKGLGYGLDQEAFETVMKWKLYPALKDGKPVATKGIVEMRFIM